MQKNPRTSLIKVPNWGKSNFCGSEFDLWLWWKSQFYYKKLASNGLKIGFLSWAWHFRICFGLVILSRNGFEIFLKRQFTIATRIFCHFYPNFDLNASYRLITNSWHFWSQKVDFGTVCVQVLFFNFWVVDHNLKIIPSENVTGGCWCSV